MIWFMTQQKFSAGWARVSQPFERVHLQSLTGSLGTTIPAYTAVMTGTPAGVGAFQSPRQFLQHGDIVEVEITGVGTLKNEIRFEEGQNTILWDYLPRYPYLLMENQNSGLDLVSCCGKDHVLIRWLLISKYRSLAWKLVKGKLWYYFSPWFIWAKGLPRFRLQQWTPPRSQFGQLEGNYYFMSIKFSVEIHMNKGARNNPRT